MTLVEKDKRKHKFYFHDERWKIEPAKKITSFPRQIEADEPLFASYN